MSEIEILKTEARKLLEEVNNDHSTLPGNGNVISCYNFEYPYESSFRERLIQLKQKVRSLHFTPVSLSQGL